MSRNRSDIAHRQVPKYARIHPDPADFLNERMPEFVLSGGTFLDVFPILDRFFKMPERPASAYPRVTEPDQNTRTPEQMENIRRFYERPITLMLEHATVREILNAVATTHGDLHWVVSWRRDSKDYPTCRLNVHSFSTGENLEFNPVLQWSPQ